MPSAKRTCARRIQLENGHKCGAISVHFAERINFTLYTTGLENVWDLVDLQKLDNHANPWNNIHLSTNATEAQGSDVVSTRQGYPGLPNPGDSNELPGPISPPITIRPIPVITPPGCLAPRGQFPSKTNCANYLNCWDDVVTEQTCPDGLLFNDVSLVCDYDYNVNCGSRPLPTPSK